MGIKAWGPLFALTALLAAGLTGIGLQYAQYNNQPQPTESENGNSPKRKFVAVAAAEPDNTKAKEKKDPQEGLKVTDWLLVLFNGLLSLYTWRLYLATRGLVDAAHNQSEDIKTSTKAAMDAAKAAITSNQIAVYNAEQQLRAYIFVKNITLEKHRHPGVPSARDTIIPGPVHTYSFCIIWENSGQTPARNMMVNFNFRSFPNQMPGDFDFPDSRPADRDVIGPRAILTLPGMDIPAAEIEVGFSQKLRWYIWAWVEYDDIFEGTPRHRTEYCCEVTVRRHPVTNAIGIGFPNHGKFNGADGEGLRPYDGHENKYG